MLDGSVAGNQITGFTVAANGTLTPLPNSTKALSSPIAVPGDIVFSPDGRLLVVRQKVASTIGFTLDVFRMAAGRAPPVLDAVDRQLLTLVQADNRRSVEHLADAVQLSVSAVQRRLQALRRSGVIIAEVAVVDPKLVGRPLTILVELTIEQERPEHLIALRRWLATEDTVQQAWYVTGDADYMLVVTAASMDGYHAFTERLLAENRNVRRFRTNVALQVTKRSLFVTVDAG